MYGVDSQRRKSEYKVNNVTKETRYYLGNYEEITDSLGVFKKIHYLRSGGNTCNRRQHRNPVLRILRPFGFFDGNVERRYAELGQVTRYKI